MSQFPLQKVRLPKPKSERPPPITWGQVKATTYQTPENLVAAVFSIITSDECLESGIGSC
uniref:Uncharacterized protein n=1 Tax=Naja naja TaxID=35670 RepID=A0A8C6X6F0_NAJNA